MIRMLYLAHHFPPVGGAGVQRSVGFTSHLRAYGVDPLVLTDARVTRSRWTPEDKSFQERLPPELRVERLDLSRLESSEARSRGGTQLARAKALIDAGSELIRTNKLGVIFVTVSPFEDLQIAAELSRRHGIPWVADLRDPWALDEFTMYRTRWHRERQILQMRRDLSGASLVIMNTPEAERRLRDTVGLSPTQRCTSITNGFDGRDYGIGDASNARNECKASLRIVHSGYLHAELGLKQRRWRMLDRILGRSICGVRLLSRSHYYLIRGLELGLQAGREELRNVLVDLVGVCSGVDKELVEGSKVAKQFRLHGYQEHHKCVDFVKGADLLFLPMHSIRKGHRSSIVPGKLYEYIATGRPVLGAVPPGDARDFLSAYGNVHLCDPEDSRGILQIILDCLQAKASGGAGRSVNLEFVRQFERRALTARLAAALHELLGASPK